MARRIKNNETTNTRAPRNSRVALPTPNNHSSTAAKPIRSVGPLRVLMISDDQSLCAGVQQAWADAALTNVSWQLSRCPSVTEALKDVSPDLPQVALLDISMPGSSGKENINCFCAALPSVPLVAVSSSTRLQDIFSVLAAGASGYMIKPATASEITRVVLGAHAGLPAFCRQTEEILRFGNLRSKAAAGCWLDDDHRLTLRQETVMACLARGYPNKVMGLVLGISPRTVEVHVCKILRKLEVRNRAEAVRLYCSTYE
jgi:two-component system, NarL family, nitrate/nitrite response regulator NarL